MFGLLLGFCGGTFRLDSRPSGVGFCEPGQNGKEKNKLGSSWEKEMDRPLLTS